MPVVSGGIPAMTRPAALRRISSRFRPYRARLALSAALILTLVALSMTWPLLLTKVINVALPQHRTGLLAVLCLSMIIAGALSSGIIVAQGAVANSLGQAVVHELRTDVYRRVQTMTLETLSGEANSKIQAILASDIGGISDLVTFTAQGALSAAVGLVAASIVMLVLNWPLALMSLLLAVVLNLANSRFTRARAQLARSKQEKVAEMLKMVSEDLAMPGVILGRTLGQWRAQRERFVEISHETAQLTCRLRLAGSSGRAMIAMTLACLPPTIYWLSGTWVPSLSLGAVVVLSTMQARLSGPIQQLLSLNGEFQSSLVMFERVFNYLDQDAPADQTAAIPSRALVAGRQDPITIDAQQIRFRYPGADRDALAGVSLCVQPGTTTVIAGASGSGKSTLALMLSGLLTASSGSLRIDGRSVSASELQADVTLISQDGVTFNASLRDNLLFGRPDANEQELQAVIDTSQLRELVSRLTDGLDAIVGERGYQLSGGERQRVALARVLLAPSRVLVADEATSALDVTTAEIVFGVLREHMRTGALVIITHRIPELADDDQVVLLDRGSIAEIGAHGALRAGNGRYSRLLRQQAAGLDWGWAVQGQHRQTEPHSCRTDPRLPEAPDGPAQEPART
jgi:ATP-binding cassette, subfamily B, bacterial